MKNITKLLPFLLLIAGCGINDPANEYEQKLTVYGGLNAGMAMIEPVTVSRTAGIDENVDSENLYINDALVYLIDDTIRHMASNIPGSSGKYITDPSVIFEAGKYYHLQVIHEGDTVRATTRVPESMEIASPIDETYLCDGEDLQVSAVNVNNLELAGSGAGFIPTVNGKVDSVVFYKGGCYTQSFASYPYFMIDFEKKPSSTVRIVTLAMEADQRGLEPYDDLNNDGVFDSGDSFLDFNRNDVRDSSFTNLIYDTSSVFRIWKEDYLRDDDNNPYRYNPFVWNVESTPVPMQWLFFNYYGLNLVLVQATDQAYYDYFSGDPFGSNQYRMPDSNIEGGYGLFSSTNTTGFYVYLTPEL